MWRKVQSNSKPAVVDTTLSRRWVYVRKNIKQIEIEGETLYEYDEITIPKDVYSIVTEQDSRLADLEEVITELVGGAE